MPRIGEQEFSRVAAEFDALQTENESSLFQMLERAGFDVDSAADAGYANVLAFVPRFESLDLSDADTVRLLDHLVTFYLFGLWCGQRAHGLSLPGQEVIRDA